MSVAEWNIIQGECREVMDREIEDESIQTVVTSPPYYGLRDYGDIDTVWGGVDDCNHNWGDSVPGLNRGGSGTPTDKNNRCENHGRDTERSCICQKCGAWEGQLGLEPLHDCGRPQGKLCSHCYVCHIVEVFRGVWDVLRDDGTVWLNLGDSYSGYHGNSKKPKGEAPSNKPGYQENMRESTVGKGYLKPKDQMGMPWRVALALQQDGWYLRSDVVWAKGFSGQETQTESVMQAMREAGVSKRKIRRAVECFEPRVGNVMPESVTDRPVSSHEFLFLLSKSEKYYFDHWAVREDSVMRPQRRLTSRKEGDTKYEGRQNHRRPPGGTGGGGRNMRDTLAINTQPFTDAHFAVFPPKIAEIPIRASTSKKGACPQCGTPLKRIIEDTEKEDPSHKNSEFDSGKTGVYMEGRASEKTRTVKKTAGWERTCGCETESEPTPCKILDPFGGAATTVLSANRLGRVGIGIEIAEKYVKMGEERIEDDLRDRLAPWQEDHPGEKTPDEKPDDPTDDDSFGDYLSSL